MERTRQSRNRIAARILSTLACGVWLVAPIRAADEGRAEIKLMVPPAAIAAARTTLQLGEPTKDYIIYFIDTPDLRLGSAGLILRLRDKHKDSLEVTLKIRPGEKTPPLGDELRSKLESETEWIIGKGENESLSLKTDYAGAAKPGDARDLTAFLSDEQKAICTQVMGGETAATDLKLYGPIKAIGWDWQDAVVGDKVSAELWDLGGLELFELSRKAKAKHLEKEGRDFEEVFSNKGIAADRDAVSKTRQALEYLHAR